jgi:hypothetical protein
MSVLYILYGVSQYHVAIVANIVYNHNWFYLIERIMKRSKDISQWDFYDTRYNEKSLGNKKEDLGYKTEEDVPSTSIFCYRWVASLSPYATALQDIKNELYWSIKSEIEKGSPTTLREENEKIQKRIITYESMEISDEAQKKLDAFMAIEDKFDENWDWIPPEQKKIDAFMAIEDEFDENWNWIPPH